MKKILVLGYFGYQTNQLDGQTVKTRDVYRLAKEQLTNCDVEYFDTQSLHKSKLLLFKMFFKVMCCKIGCPVRCSGKQKLKSPVKLLIQHSEF